MSFSLRAYLNPPCGRAMLGIILLVIICDQLVKYVMLDIVGIAARPPIIVTEFFKLVMVWNHGISFGMLSMPETIMPYILMTLAVAICLLVWHLAGKSACAYERLAYSAIIGGALGNVIDRARFGAVADFFYFHIGTLGWPAFNIADASIFLGVMFLLWRAFFPSRAQHSPKA